MASTDAHPVPQKNVAYRVTFPMYDADGDLVTGASSPDSEVSKDGGTFTDCTNEATEIATSSGMYFLDLTSTEMNADTVAVIVKSGTAGMKTTVIVLYPQETGDIKVDVQSYGGSAGTFASGRPEVNASHIAGSAVSTSSAQIGVNVIQAAGTAWNSGAIGAATLATDTITAAKIAADAIGASELADGAIDAATFAAGAITAAAIAADAITDAKVAADVTIASVTGSVGSVTGAVGSVTGAVGSVTGNVGGSVASVASGGISRASLAADTGLQSIRSNTAAAGAAGTVTLDAAASAVDSFYNGLIVLLTGGTGVGQARLLRAYVGATKVASIEPNWITAPDNTSTFALLPLSYLFGISADDPRTDAIDAALVTIDDFVDTEVAAIKAKTDNLPATPAATGDAMTLTAGERNAVADALLDRSNGIETSLTPRQAVRLMAAALAGKLSGAATTTLTIRNVGDSKDRITATVDANGNRSAVTTDAT